MTESQPERFAELAGGLRLHYLERGDPGAEPMLLVHGLTREAHSFDPVLDWLGQHFHCLAPDLRGRGHSPWASPEVYTPAQYAEDLCALLDVRGIGAVHWVGTSLGGIIALWLAAERPERFRSLVLNDMGVQVEPEGSQRIADHLAAMPAAFESLEALLAFEINRFPWLAELPAEALRARYTHMVRRNGDGTWRMHFDPAVALGRARTPEQREALQQRLWEGFQALDCPVLVLRGAESDLLAEGTVWAMRSVRPATREAEIPGVGHPPSLGEPESVRALADFYGVPAP